MNRRSLLRGLFAAPAVVAASSLMPISVRALVLTPPRLWGDGIHDDTAALNWLARQAAAEGRPFVLNNAVHRLSGPIIINDVTVVHLNNSVFKPDSGDFPAIEMGNVGQYTKVNNRVDYGNSDLSATTFVCNYGHSASL